MRQAAADSRIAVVTIQADGASAFSDSGRTERRRPIQPEGDPVQLRRPSVATQMFSRKELESAAAKVADDPLAVIDYLQLTERSEERCPIVEPADGVGNS